MRLSFRLAELHNYTPDPKKRPGVIKNICDHTGLDRHQVAALLRNEVKHIPLDALSRLCDYLVAKGLATADKLPGALFAVEAEHFWELLARRRRLELCVGVRRGDVGSWKEHAWVVAADSVLMGELLNGVSTLGGAPGPRAGSAVGAEGATGDASAATVAATSDAGTTGAVPPLATAVRLETLRPGQLKQSLVWSPGGPQADSSARALHVYEKFADSDGDKALVCLGTTKSNPLAELIVSSAFNLTPFESQDEIAEPGQRGCPFYVRYRAGDPHPKSTWGGLRLSRRAATDDPGIYFEKPDGTWDCFKCDDKSNDAAYVFYTYRESQGWLEMAMGGFSGRATRLLARTLMTRAEEFWPPENVGGGLRIGAFLVRYEFPPGEEQTQDPLQTDLVAHTEITRIDREVLLRRLEPTEGGSGTGPTSAKPK